MATIDIATTKLIDLDALREFKALLSTYEPGENIKFTKNPLTNNIVISSDGKTYWIGTRAQYLEQEESIPIGTLVGFTDDAEAVDPWEAIRNITDLLITPEGVTNKVWTVDESGVASWKEAKSGGGCYYQPSEPTATDANTVWIY